MSEYEDSYERSEKDLSLHLAAMLERMEWENELPAHEKHKRRLINQIQSLPTTAELAAKHDMPFLMFGCIERIVYHAEQLLGADWRERVCRERSTFLGTDEEDEPE